MAVLDEIILKEARQRLTLYANEELKGLARNPEREKLDRELLEKGLKYYEQLAQTNATDWAARRARARAYANVGLLRLDLKNYAESERAYRQAVRLMEELAGERPNDFDNAYDLAYTYHWSYRAYWDSGRIQAAEEITRHALALFEKLAADFPDRAPLALEYQAYCHRNLGGLLVKIAKPQEAEKAFRRSIAIWTELAAANPQAPGYRYALGYDLRSLCDLFRQTGQRAKAMDAWREAHALWEKLAVELPGEHRYRSEVAHLDWHLAALLKEDGKPKGAEEAYRRALRRFEKLAADYPAEAFYRQEVAATCFLLAGLFKETGQVREVEKAYRQALPIYEKLASDLPGHVEFRSRLWWNLSDLAETLLVEGKHAEAAKVAEKIASVLPKEANWYQCAVGVLARCAALAEKDAKLSDADRKAVVQGYADRSSELMQEAEKLYGNDPDFWSQRGDAYLNQGQQDKAIGHYTKAIELKPDNPDFWHKRGAVYLLQRRWNESVADYTKAIALKPDESWFYHERCFAYLSLRQYEKAAADCTRGIELNPKEWSFWARRGDAYRGMGLHDKALAEYRQALALAPKEEWTWKSRGHLYAEMGQWDKAAADFAKAAELAPKQAQAWYYRALVRLGASDMEGYRRICADILERFGKTEDPDTAYWVAWPCVVAPEAIAKPELLVPLAEKSLTKGPTNYDYLTTLGAAQYRAGRFEEAVKRLDQAAAAYKPEARFRQPVAYSWFFLAMAHHRLGQAGEAQKSLDKAVQWMDQANQKKGQDAASQVPMPWNRRLTLQLLRGEAETLIGAAKQE
jgi:tetratricopeptide (TPR) repeat protein